MARVLFKRGTTEEIEALPTEDGAFIVDTEKGKSYTDVGGKRIPVGSAGNEVVIGDESQITEDTKLFINPDEVQPQGNDVVDSLAGNETDKAPSVRAVKERLGKSDLEDITSQCTFHNCTLVGGKILVDRKNKILYFHIAIKATITNSWIRVVTVPDDITPLVVATNGAALGSTPFWIYADHAVNGGIEADKQFSISAVCLLQ